MLATSNSYMVIALDVNQVILTKFGAPKGNLTPLPPASNPANNKCNTN